MTITPDASSAAVEPDTPHPDRGWAAAPCVLRDVDGDGVDDICTLDAYRENSTWVLSGRSGRVLFERPTNADENSNRFRPPIPCGLDLDGDGIEDLLDVSAGVVMHRSTRTGLILNWLDARASGPATWGRLLDAGDFDGDGISDLLVVRSPWDNRSMEDVFATVISGRDGRVLLTVLDSRLCGDSHAEICTIGDADGDGRRDLATARWNASTRTFQVELISGSDGARIRTLDGIPGIHEGILVQDAGDLDGDGVHDLLVGSEELDVRVYSGCDGRVLFEEKRARIPTGLNEWAYTGFGTRLASFVDARGAAFVLMGTPDSGWDDGAVECWSVTEHRRLFAIRPPEKHDVWHFGDVIEVLGDIDGDGTPDFAVSPLHLYCGNPGRIYVCSGRTGEFIWSAVRTLTGVDVERGS